MSSCEMCGSANATVKAKVEGSELKLCMNCAKYGKVISRVFTESHGTPKSQYKKPELPEKLEIVNEDFSEIIKKAREKLGLKQEELAQKIAEKESLIHHIESGQFTPSIDLAKKFEKFLKIKLVEEYKENHDSEKKKNSNEVTIGDFIKIRKRP
jgi:putative transcription factor